MTPRGPRSRCAPPRISRSVVSGLSVPARRPPACSPLPRRQIAGMTAKVFEHPFDLTKVRLQSQVLDHTARFSGPIDCLTQTWKKEGVRGLYRVRAA